MVAHHGRRRPPALDGLGGGGDGVTAWVGREVTADNRERERERERGEGMIPNQTTEREREGGGEGDCTLPDNRERGEGMVPNHTSRHLMFCLTW